MLWLVSCAVAHHHKSLLHNNFLRMTRSWAVTCNIATALFCWSWWCDLMWWSELYPSQFSNTTPFFSLKNYILIHFSPATCTLKWVSAPEVKADSPFPFLFSLHVCQYLFPFHSSQEIHIDISTFIFASFLSSKFLALYFLPFSRRINICLDRVTWQKVSLKTATR